MYRMYALRTCDGDISAIVFDSSGATGVVIPAPKNLIIGIRTRYDRTPPPIMSAILAAVGGNPKVEPFIYENANHGFANHIRADVYDPEATRAANERTMHFFEKHLA